MTQRRQISGEEKALILRELLENQAPLSELSEKYHVRGKRALAPAL